MPRKPQKFLDQVRDALRVRGYVVRTKERYLDWVKRYILFTDKHHPREMGAPEIAEFLTYLAVEKHISPSTQNQARGALLFLYPEILMQKSKRPSRPSVLEEKSGCPLFCPKTKRAKLLS